MELRIEITRLDTCVRRLSVCESILSKKENELLEIREKICRSCSPEEAKALDRVLLKQTEALESQSRQLKNLQSVLSKAVKLYDYNEEELLQLDEPMTRRVEEKLRIVHLKDLEQIKIKLR
ncbi:MAG: hypothetical protein J6A75_11570 [Lachnospiraceae bacterium]|nr:hypothetical protein [Lachnospiraceae bacterium]